MEKNELAVVVQQYQTVEITKAQGIASQFAGAMAKVNELSPVIGTLNTEQPTSLDSQKAREARLTLVKNRTGAEELKNRLKRSLLDEGKLIDGLFNVVANSSKMLEVKLEEVEKYVELQEKARKEEVKRNRVEQLAQYEVDTTFYDLINMSDDGFSTLLASSKIAYEQKLEKIKREEEQAKLEQAKQAVLNERRIEIAPYQNFVDKVFTLTADTTKEMYDIQLTKAKGAKGVFDIEQEKIRKENIELKRVADEKAKADEEAEKKRQAELAKERKEREEAEKKLKEIEAEKAKVEAIQKEQERQALLAPDKEKVKAYFEAIKAVEKPMLKDATLSKKIDVFMKAIESLITNF